MNKNVIGAAVVALPLAVGGYVAANSVGQANDEQTQAAEEGYICPATGEELPCPACCPFSEAE